MSTHYTIIDLPQGTSEWRAWRHEGIGASEAASVMGQNRFKSADQLLQEKRGPVPNLTPNAAMALGSKLEPEARRRYVAKVGKVFHPICLQSNARPWLRASLDGLAINHDAVVEIKCGQSVYRRTYQSRSVPVYYYAQLQHILAITNLPTIDLWCHWPPYPDLLLKVVRNNGYIDRMLSRESEFWQTVQDFRAGICN